MPWADAAAKGQLHSQTAPAGPCLPRGSVAGCGRVPQGGQRSGRRPAVCPGRSSPGWPACPREPSPS